MQNFLVALQGPMPDGGNLSNAIRSLPSISIPSLNPNLKSGVNNNVGGALDASLQLNEGDWIVSTGSAAVGFNGKKAIELAAIGVDLRWLLKNAPDTVRSNNNKRFAVCSSRCSIPRQSRLIT